MSMGWKTFFTLVGMMQSHVRGRVWEPGRAWRTGNSSPVPPCTVCGAASGTCLTHWVEQSSAGEPATILQLRVIVSENLQFISVLELRFCNTLLLVVSRILVKIYEGPETLPCWAVTAAEFWGCWQRREAGGAEAGTCCLGSAGAVRPSVYVDEHVREIAIRSKTS